MVPTLWAYEIRNVALMGVRRRRISIRDAEDFLRSLGELGIRVIALARSAHVRGILSRLV